MTHRLPIWPNRSKPALRAKLIFTAQVELAPPRSLPRTEMKAALIEHRY